LAYHLAALRWPWSGPSDDIDRARCDLWARQVRVDAAARNHATVNGDVATLEWIRNRIARSLDRVALTRIDSRLEELRAEVAEHKLAAAAKTPPALRKLLARAGVTRVDR